MPPGSYSRGHNYVNYQGVVILFIKAILLCCIVFGAMVFVGNIRAATAWVTGYSTHENLTGCTSPGVCHTACGGLLIDRRRTVAANPKWGLGCGAKLRFCYRSKCATATVTDRTGSYFDFEFSYALALATGQNPHNWASPRRVIWSRL